MVKGASMPIMATTTIKNIGDRLAAEGLDDERDGMDLVGSCLI
jgi:hypothetical protein